MEAQRPSRNNPVRGGCVTGASESKMSPDGRERGRRTVAMIVQRVKVRAPARRAVRVLWRGGRHVGRRWMATGRGTTFSAPSWPVSIAMHGAIVAVLLRVPMPARVLGLGEARPVVAVDISQLPRPIPPPPPPPLTDLPKREVPLPDPMPVPEPTPMEIAAVRFPTNDLPELEAEFEVEDLWPELFAAPAPEPPPVVEDALPGTDRIREAIVRHLTYPESARRRGEEGRVLLILRVADDGGVEAVDGEGASWVLVQAALRAARRAAPFAGVKAAVYRIPIRFRLVD